MSQQYQTGDYVRIHDHDGAEITVKITDSGIPNRQGDFAFKSGARIFNNKEILGLGEVPVVSEKKFEIGDQVITTQGSRAVVVEVRTGSPFPYLIQFSGGMKEWRAGRWLSLIAPFGPISDIEVHADLAVENDAVNHPAHYGGDTTYEAIKVIDAWGLGFALGNLIKYVARAGKKDPAKELEDLRKARFYLNHRITQLEQS